MVEMICKNCIHWVKSPIKKQGVHNILGECRAFPPQMNNSGYGYWPLIGDDKWCSHFKCEDEE